MARLKEIYHLRQRLQKIGDPRKLEYKKTHERLQRLMTMQLKAEIKQARRAS
jgi:hypothetical protein